MDRRLLLGEARSPGSCTVEAPFVWTDMRGSAPTLRDGEKMMRVFTLAVLMLATMTAAAKDRGPYEYQDGVLVSLRHATFEYQDGILVSFRHATADARGGVDTRIDDDVYYMVAVGDRTYVLSHVIEFLYRPSDLQGQQRGAHVQVRMDKRALYVRVNDRESKFNIVEAK